MKAYITKDSEGKEMLWIYCPGCKTLHGIQAKWFQFNGDLEKPSLSGSVVIGKEDEDRCHFFLYAGTLEYCSDSVHDLKYGYLPLPDIPDEYLPDPPKEEEAEG